MAISHIRKVWALACLSPTLKFILMALANHASEDNNQCWPGYDRLANLTGFTKKTVQRSVRVLEKIGLISVDREKTYNRYTLHLNGDIEDLNRYLEYNYRTFEDYPEDSFSKGKSSKSSKTLIEKGALKTEEKSQSVASCSQDAGGEALPPCQLETGVSVAWKRCLEKIYGSKVPFTPKDRWVLERFKESMNHSGMPAEKIIEIVVPRWPEFNQHIKLHTSKYKVEYMPSTHFLYENGGEAISFAYQYLFPGDG